MFVWYRLEKGVNSEIFSELNEWMQVCTSCLMLRVSDLVVV